MQQRVTTFWSVLENVERSSEAKVGSDDGENLGANKFDEA